MTATIYDFRTRRPRQPAPGRVPGIKVLRATSGEWLLLRHETHGWTYGSRAAAIRDARRLALAERLDLEVVR